MTIASLPLGFGFAPAGVKPDAPAAAREFEALLIARLLKTARQAGETLGEAATQTGAEGYLELAEEHVARAMAQRGAFGIAQMLLKNMDSTQQDNPGSGAGAGSRAGDEDPGGAAPGG